MSHLKKWESKEWQIVPIEIHPLDRPDIEDYAKLLNLLAYPPSAKCFEDSNDYYAYWWNSLLREAPKIDLDLCSFSEAQSIIDGLKEEIMGLKKEVQGLKSSLSVNVLR